MPAPGSITPFSFAELSPSAPEPAAITYTRADLDQARLDGVIEGRNLAAASIAEMDRQTLHAIEIKLAAASGCFSKGLAQERTRLAHGAAEFLDHFCSVLACDREIEAAKAMIDQLLQHSLDRTPAVLHLPPASLSRLAARIEAVISAAGATDFLSVESDASLAVGDCRIEWRGGALERRQSNLASAVDALFRATAEEDSHDKA